MFPRQSRGISHQTRRYRSSQYPLWQPLNAAELDALWDMPLPAFDDPTVNGVAFTAGQLSLQNNHQNYPHQQLHGSQGQSAEDAICLD
jgi:hypothetical protein